MEVTNHRGKNLCGGEVANLSRSQSHYQLREEGRCLGAEIERAFLAESVKRRRRQSLCV